MEPLEPFEQYLLPKHRSESMQVKNLPKADTQYWIAILLAGSLGTIIGDFVSNDLNLGFEGALLPFSVIMTIILIAEHLSTKRSSTAWYWIAIVLTPGLASNLGDFLSHTLNLGNGKVSVIFSVLLLALLFSGRHQLNEPVTPRNTHDHKLLPLTDTRYWIAIIMTSTFGTTTGDYISGDLGVGFPKASLILITLIAIILLLEIFTKKTNETRYWFLIALVWTTGDVTGDFLTSKQGLNLGFLISATIVTILLITVLLIPKRVYTTNSSWRFSG